MKIVTICEDYYHPGAPFEKVIRELTNKDKHEFVYDKSGVKSGILEGCNLLIIARSDIYGNDYKTMWMSDDFKQRFISYAKNGGRLLILHSGTVGYGKDPELSKIFSGYFDFHPPQTEVTFIPLGDFDITKGIDPYTFIDEHYHMVMIDENIDIFAQAKSEHGVQPAGWLNTQEGMRIGTLLIGHNSETLESVEYKLLLRRMIDWCWQ